MTLTLRDSKGAFVWVSTLRRNKRIVDKRSMLERIGDDVASGSRLREEFGNAKTLAESC
jgi:hypothetical protein